MYGYHNPYLNESRKAAIYARVSTEHEEQLSALENQKDWYKPILEQHPEWEIVQMYVDEGVTGTSAKKRKNFLKMISDAECGKFDLILTREVSRFARNTVDTLQYTRSLKAKGVEVYFINDNIRTFDGDGELRLTIMATLAQDESRKTSIRVKAGQQTSMENGVYYGNGSILGYDRVGKEMVINPEQAKTVRMIYDWYLAGEGLRSIQFKLEQAGRLTAMGKTTWHMTNISKILKNTFYCGIITYHKQWTPDYLEQKKINNHGEIEKTVVQGTHEPIVTVEEFEAVQKRFQMNHPCYAMMTKRFGKVKTYEEWCEPKLVENALDILDKEIPKLKNKISSVQLCFTTDPFMYGYPEVSEMSIRIIKKLNSVGIKCTVLTKGVLPESLADLSKENEYGITLVSLSEEFRKEMEPNSAPFSERVEALKNLHNLGCKTWVSIEPYPTPNMIEQDFDALLNAIGFVDKIIFGRLHYNKRVTEYKNHKQFFNSLADRVIKYCNDNQIDYHIKSGTKTD